LREEGISVYGIDLPGRPELVGGELAFPDPVADRAVRDNEIGGEVAGKNTAILNSTTFVSSAAAVRNNNAENP
jgi:hypothetical protein